MAGPQFVGPTGAQFNQQNIQTMQQGIESIANMGKFLESQRQYNESQKLLVDKFHQEQLQNLQEKYQKMFDQKVKDSVGGTAMDVATTDPGFFTDYMSIISGKDKASAEQELNNIIGKECEKVIFGEDDGMLDWSGETFTSGENYKEVKLEDFNKEEVYTPKIPMFITEPIVTEFFVFFNKN